MTPRERVQFVQQLEVISQNRAKFYRNYRGTNDYDDMQLILQLNTDVRDLANTLLSSLPNLNKENIR